VAALGKLDAALAPSGKVVKVGTLVVFSHGPDVAGRVDGDTLHDKVWESPYDVIAIRPGSDAATAAASALLQKCRRFILIPQCGRPESHTIVVVSHNVADHGDGRQNHERLASNHPCRYSHQRGGCL
jgi:hypothetical protein